jgi:hypothetical protein
MKHLFNDLPSEEKTRILEMHKKASDKHYLTENITIDDFKPKMECIIDNQAEYLPALRAAWGRCKNQNKYKHLSQLAPNVFTSFLLSMMAAIELSDPHHVISDRSKITNVLAAKIIFNLLKLDHGPQRSEMEQEIRLAYDCISKDEGVLYHVTIGDLCGVETE